MNKFSPSILAAYAFLGFSLSMISFFMLDETIYHIVLVHDEAAHETWQLITELGDSLWMAIALVATFVVGFGMRLISPASTFWQPIPNRAVFVFSAVALSGIAVLIIKGIVGRARPYLFDTEGPFGFNPMSFDSVYASWPSGHTTTAFAFATALILLNSKLKWIMIPFAILAGYSRMALGAHYLADVIAGATLGTLSVIALYQWLKPKLKL